MLKILGFGALAGAGIWCFADNGTDLLAGTTQSAVATYQGSITKYIYLGEGVVAAISYIRTKNILVLLGILAIMLFINFIVMKVTH